MRNLRKFYLEFKIMLMNRIAFILCTPDIKELLNLINNLINFFIDIHNEYQYNLIDTKNIECFIFKKKEALIYQLIYRVSQISVIFKI